MPLLARSDYRCPMALSNPHLQTILPVLFRPVPTVDYVRHRLELPDGDFIDIDTSCAAADGEQGSRAVILSHGLEGNTGRHYMTGMARALLDTGWDVVARHFRGCSGEVNRHLGFYHSGETGDLDSVVHWCLARGYSQLVLIGFSMGGNQTLKYLGEYADDLPPAICGAVTFSVPCDLAGAAEVLDRPGNAFYMAYFMRTLRAKMVEKAVRFPDAVDVEGIDAIKHFVEFDERYTAPMFGFESAFDYWQRASSRPYLPSINVPTLLVNAEDDPFLSPSCFPHDEASSSAALTLEVPAHGGHVGFVAVNHDNRFWSESRAVEFVSQL